LLGGERPRFPSFGFGILPPDILKLLQGFVPPALKGCRDQPVGAIRLTLRQYFFILLIFILTVSAMEQKNPLPS
jgi:hypothetical protein